MGQGGGERGAVVCEKEGFFFFFLKGIEGGGIFFREEVRREGAGVCGKEVFFWVEVEEAGVEEFILVG